MPMYKSVLQIYILKVKRQDNQKSLPDGQLSNCISQTEDILNNNIQYNQNSL